MNHDNEILEFIRKRCELDSRVSLYEIFSEFKNVQSVNNSIQHLATKGLIKRDYAEDVEIFYRAV